MRSIMMTAGILTLTLAACGSSETEQAEAEAGSAAESAAATATSAPVTAVATLQTADGQPAGIATASETDGTVRVYLQVEGLTPGEHGVHVHTIGVCEAPKFESAGPHWNPAEHKHGLEAADGQHAGDMPNLVVAEDGTGTLEYTLEGGATFAGLMDADGSAFMVHAMPDDQTTDPSGASGDRIACGVFTAS